MINLKNYKKVDLCIYYRLIKRLIYFLYKTKLDIIFVIRKLNKYNTNLREKIPLSHKKNSQVFKKDYKDEINLQPKINRILIKRSIALQQNKLYKQ